MGKENHLNAEQPWVLVIDQGGHASRASIISVDGQIIADGEIPITPLPVDAVHVEYDPQRMLASISDAIAKTTRDLDITRISQAALATQRSNVVCWDLHTGVALSPIISWQDRRAADWLATRSDLADEIHRQTGLFISAHYGASKLHWCREHIPAVSDAARVGRLAWGPMSSWLTRQMCQEAPFICDAVNASRTMLWSITDCDWSEALIHAFNLEDGKFPTSVANYHDFGSLNVRGHSIPMRIVTGDQAAAIYANGQPTQDTAYVTVGTGAFILNPCGSTPSVTQNLLSTLIWLEQDRPSFAHEGTINGASCALDFYARQLGQPDYIEQMEQWLQRDASLPLFLNGYAGLGTPYMRADFNSCFIGRGDAVSQLLAVVESIIFLLAVNLQHLLELNPAITRIALGGGLANYDGFCQRLADLGLPVQRSRQTETTSQGLAKLLAQGQTGNDKFGMTTDTTFLPNDNAALRLRFQNWQEAMIAALGND